MANDFNAPVRSPFMVMIPQTRTTAWARAWFHKRGWAEEVSYMKTCGPYWWFSLDHDEDLSGFTVFPHELTEGEDAGIIVVYIYPIL